MTPHTQFKEDELAGEATYPPRQTNKTTTNATPAAIKVESTGASQPAATPVIDADEVDLIGNYNELRALPTLPSVLPKGANEVARLAILRYKAFKKETHYLVGVGPNSKGMTVACPGPGCPECFKGGSEHSSRRKVAALAIKYETSADGKFAKGITRPVISIGFILLSPTGYSEVADLPSEGEDIFGIDIKATHKSNNIGWSFNRMSAPPAYVKAGMEADVAALAEPYLDFKILRSRLGKVVTVLEMKALLSGNHGIIDTASSLDDIEAI